MRILIVLFFTVSWPKQLYYQTPYNFVIWNVGQGSWATLITIDKCFHIDMGGEIYPQKVDSLCSKKKNIIFITHEDWDHIGFVSRFSRKTKNYCLIENQVYKKRHLKKVKKCQTSASDGIKRIDKGSLFGSRNQMSSTYIVLKKVLITGDAPIKREKVWLPKIHRKLPILILGHHGSHTSTSVKLLDKIKPNLAIASARKSRYGHPHKKVIKKLRTRNIPLIRTEIWGHLFMAL